MSAQLPFPGHSQLQQSGVSANDFASDLTIDLSRGKEDTQSGSHRRQSSFQSGDKFHHNPSTAPPAGWHHHPRQPGPYSDSYFPGGGMTASASAGLPKTPGSSSMRGHGRAISSSGAGPSSAAAGLPMSINLGAAPNVDGTSTHSAFGGGFSHGPPSPSTLTDVILGLHNTFYSAKRKPEEVQQMVSRYYESGAVFESPLLSAHGRDQIANQFIMAFALPGMDVQSELRDVICSDFEFDGTRAGIIDHTITVTFLPSLFGSSTKAASDAGASDVNRTPRAHPGQSVHGYPLSALPMTPHPFIDYAANSSAFSRFGGQSHPHSPTTPFSISSIWGGSRPHTPGHPSSVRPLSGTSAHPTHTPPSVNGEDPGTAGSANLFGTLNGGTHTYIDAETLQQQLAARPAIPADALQPHWTQEGLGRKTFRTLLWSLFHPRAVLKSLFSIQLRVMSRLEFNDAGLIVRHEDTWGLRETIEGIIPLASLIYSVERRLVGFLVSWAIDKGFRLSSALLRKAIPGRAPSESEYQITQHEAESMFQQQPQHLYQHPYRSTGREFHTISRSRAPSPNRFRFGGSTDSRSGTVTGTRSRARSLVGQGGSIASSRAMSTDNLMQHFGQAEPQYQSRRSADLPPDSSAKFRERTAKRLEGGRATSTNSAPPTTCDAADYGPTGNLVSMWEQFSNHSQAASVVSNDDRTPSRAPDQDQH
ncbi:hypothetical protein BCV70DRAFT_212594 [Testicularia cyperi]|uniref:Uncharacterized protein n=1 Tax=Testicularia cyperi TaxID=1882483 RepID=A0A317XMT0_9BASI|nr:hypothetical protein BCV70DRAFT_212594 [Testicularia cyperi]